MRLPRQASPWLQHELKPPIRNRFSGPHATRPRIRKHGPGGPPVQADPSCVKTFPASGEIYAAHVRGRSGDWTRRPTSWLARGGQTARCGTKSATSCSRPRPLCAWLSGTERDPANNALERAAAQRTAMRGAKTKSGSGRLGQLGQLGQDCSAYEGLGPRRPDCAVGHSGNDGRGRAALVFCKKEAVAMAAPTRRITLSAGANRAHMAEAVRRAAMGVVGRGASPPSVALRCPGLPSAARAAGGVAAALAWRRHRLPPQHQGPRPSARPHARQTTDDRRPTEDGRTTDRRTHPPTDGRPATMATDCRRPTKPRWPRQWRLEPRQALHGSGGRHRLSAPPLAPGARPADGGEGGGRPVQRAIRVRVVGRMETRGLLVGGVELRLESWVAAVSTPSSEAARFAVGRVRRGAFPSDARHHGAPGREPERCLPGGGTQPPMGTHTDDPRRVCVCAIKIHRSESIEVSAAIGGPAWGSGPRSSISPPMQRVVKQATENFFERGHVSPSPAFASVPPQTTPRCAVSSVRRCSKPSVRHHAYSTGQLSRGVRGLGAPTASERRRGARRAMPAI